ncbi:hypothetical protein TNCV_1760651 [Trichonephila clavipes]|nr:hypothetical protein TNCV_1760651 [Trichonephila clavipes]
MDDITHGRMIGNLEARRRFTSADEEFRINKNKVSHAWKGFQTIGEKSPIPVSKHHCSATMYNNRVNVTKRLHKGDVFACRLERCIHLKIGRRRHQFEWYKEHK